MSDEAIDLGSRLGEDKWLVFNTLPFIFEHLDTLDLLSCSRVCKLWHEVAQDPKYWKSMHFSKNRAFMLNLSGFFNVLKKRKTTHLKMDKGCSIEKEPFQPTRATKAGNTLKTLEIRECSTKMCETFLRMGRNLESIKIEMICCAFLNKSKIDLISKMPHLRELRLTQPAKSFCLRIFQIDLRDLKVLYLLNAENLLEDVNRHLKTEIKSNKLEVLALGNVGDMRRTEISAILQASPALKKLRLESCINWYPVDFFETIGSQKNLTCVELLNFKIVAHFEHSVKCCPNIEELTVMPSFDRFDMVLFNFRLFMAAHILKKTIKKFTVGFSKKYLDYMKNKVDQENVIPFPKYPIDFSHQYSTGHPSSESRSWVPMTFFKAKLSRLMPDTEVQVTKLDSLGNIFT